MRNRFLVHSLFLALGCLFLGACSNSSSSGTATLGPGATTGAAPAFDGVGSADAISPTDVVVSWSAATSKTASPGSIRYFIYRALDAATVLLESALVGSTPAGVTSFVDQGLPPYTTFFYRVVAEDPAGRRSTSQAISSARTPTNFAPGNFTYAADIEPLWNTPNPTQPTQNCLSCHDPVSATPALPDLTSWTGLMTGLGTQQNPDSVVVAYDGESTWLEFVARFTSNPLPHIGYFSDPAGFKAAFQQPLTDWANEGALELPDNTPPIFEFNEIKNAGKYNGQYLDFETVEINWFDASDPESLPFNGDNTGQIEYVIYAGLTTDTIDWSEPIVREIFSPATSTTFNWPHPRISAVVRALDASGRANAWPAPGSPTFEQDSQGRRRNASVNEQEILLEFEIP